MHLNLMKTKIPSNNSNPEESVQFTKIKLGKCNSTLKVLALGILCMCAPLLIVKAQITSFQATYGDHGSLMIDDAYSGQQTSDGGYILAGETYSFGIGGGQTTVYVVKTNSLGDTLWTKAKDQLALSPIC